MFGMDKGKLRTLQRDKDQLRKMDDNRQLERRKNNDQKNTRSKSREGRERRADPEVKLRSHFAKMKNSKWDGKLY